jgi:hypothetical protein
MGANTAARGGQEGGAAAVAGGQSLTTEGWRHYHRFHGVLVQNKRLPHEG